MRAPLLIFISGALVFVVSTALSILYFISDDITGGGITEATLFHILYGFEGVDIGNFTTYVALLLISCGGASLVCWGAWKICVRKSKAIFDYRPSRVIHLAVIGGLSVFAVGVHPATLESIAVAKTFYDTRYSSLLSAEIESFEHVKPPEHGKSLVYIYAESLERTFFDPKLFPGLIRELAELEKTSLSIRGIGQSPLSDWTIAGMVASQCGMPLATFRHNRNNLSDVQSFLPGATCTGDLLHERGYQLAYMGGADLSFAGKGRFYFNHHFEDVTGLNEFRTRYGEDLPVSKWGVYDDRLFEHALKKFRALSSTKKPFALYLLTLDTHPPLGHPTPACANKSEFKYGNGASHILNSVKCSDHLISDLVKRIEAEAGDDVVIIVASDHWMMRSDAAERLAQGQARENLFIVRGAGIDPKEVTKPSATMDIAPTVLSLLGWDIKTMALGRNLLGQEPTLVEKYGRDHFYEMVKAWRMNLWQMWRKDSASVDQMM